MNSVRKGPAAGWQPFAEPPHARRRGVPPPAATGAARTATTPVTQPKSE